MTEQPQTKALAISNYDKIKALASNANTIKRFQEMLGSRREAQSYITSALMAVANSKDLMECTPSSVFNGVIRSAALRLSCDPALRQAHLVPFNIKIKATKNVPEHWEKKATLIIGYIGLNNMAMRTGKYRFLNAGALYEGQVMEINQLTGETVLRGIRTSDTVLGYFHYFELFSGLSSTYYMTVEQLKAHAQQYAPKNPLWQSDFPAMAKKTVTRMNLLKNGILDPADRALIEEMQDDTPDGEIVENSDHIDLMFTESDDAQAEQEAIEAAAKVKAERDAMTPEQKKAREEAINKDLGFESDHKAPPAIVDPSAEQSKMEPLRYQPEQLILKILETSRAMTGPANGKRGVVVSMLDTILSTTTNPTESRHMLLKYLTGKASTKDIPDNVMLALYKWLAPRQDAGGEWQPDAMAAREAMAAFVAAQPPQENLL